MTINSENRLYYYCTLDTAINYILNDCRLRLNPLKYTNDPRENKYFTFGTISNKVIDWRKASKEISEMINDIAKVLCFTQDNGQTYRGFESSRMWAYYGGGHKGVCLLIDKVEFVNENKHLINPKFLQNIKYVECDDSIIQTEVEVNYLEIEKFGIKKYLNEIFIPENLRSLFFTKNKEWSSEQEIRLLHLSNKNESEFCSIQESLKAIYLGVDFQKNYLPSLIDLCPQVDIFSLEYNIVKLLPLLTYEGKINAITKS